MNILYSMCWEDYNLPNKYLKIKRNDSVLCIASGGENLFSLALNNPKRIIGIDNNVQQIYLVNLKKAAILSLKFEEFIKFIGFSECNNRLELFKKCFHSLGLKLGFSVGLIFLITFLGYAYLLSKALPLSSLFFSTGTLGALGFCIFYFVERPIRKLRQSTEKIASGDFNQPIEFQSSDELGDLAAAFEERRQKIKEITTALKTSQQEFQSLFMPQFFVWLDVGKKAERIETEPLN